MNNEDGPGNEVLFKYANPPVSLDNSKKVLRVSSIITIRIVMLRKKYPFQTEDLRCNVVFSIFRQGIDQKSIQNHLRFSSILIYFVAGFIFTDNVFHNRRSNYYLYYHQHFALSPCRVLYFTFKKENSGKIYSQRKFKHLNFPQDKQIITKWWCYKIVQDGYIFSRYLQRLVCL